MKFLFALALGVFALHSSAVWGSPRSHAYIIHSRLTGVPPSGETLNTMTAHIQAGNVRLAINEALSSPYFYDLFLKEYFKSWTNMDSSPRVPLNDMVATMVGMVRDNTPFDQVLYGDNLYISDDSTLPPYARDNNDHYEQIEAQGISLFTELQNVSQQSRTTIADTAGVITSRAYGNAFFSMGTNRRVTERTFMNFLCYDFFALHDNTIPDYRVRKDVTRSPGGDSRTYKNKCAGCHAGQDALGGAWAYFDYVDNQLVHTPGVVVTKMIHNVLYEDGYETVGDDWLNTWANGQNAFLGWRGPVVGNGANQFGRMMAGSRAFSTCMVKRAYKRVCLSEADSSVDELINQVADKFEQDNLYNLKNLIGDVAEFCLEEEE